MMVKVFSPTHRILKEKKKSSSNFIESSENENKQLIPQCYSQTQISREVKIALRT
jgi:hypothetical protein